MTEWTEDNVEWTNCLRSVNIENYLVAIYQSSLDLVIMQLIEVIEEHYEHYELRVSYN